MPIEAEIHKRQLSFLYNIMSSNNTSIQKLMDRQLIMNIDNQLSFFCRATATLDMYNLPSIDDIRKELPSKIKWKSICKQAIHAFWTEKMQTSIKDKSSLKFMNIKDLKVGNDHSVWTSLNSSVTEVKKGIIKARMLTGTYLLQKNKQKFSNGKIDPTCPLCNSGEEDLAHMLLYCAATFSIRKEYFRDIKQIVIEHIGKEAWINTFTRPDSLVKLLIDCTSFEELFKSKEQLSQLMRMTTELCYKLHIRRIWLRKES